MYKELGLAFEKAKEIHPCVMILHDIDRLMPRIAEQNGKLIRSLQISKRIIQYLNELNEWSMQTQIIIVATCSDPIGIDEFFMSQNMFHEIYCLNEPSKYETNPKKKELNSQNDMHSTTHHLQLNLKYLHTLISSHFHCRHNLFFIFFFCVFFFFFCLLFFLYCFFCV